jgi:hypothetical protein
MNAHDAIGLSFRPDTDTLPALASEREALWASLEKTTFLTEAEKRALAGFSPVPDSIGTKFNPYHDELGRFTTTDGAGGGSIGRAPDGTPVDPAQGRRGGSRRSPSSTDSEPGPIPPILPGTAILNERTACHDGPTHGTPRLHPMPGIPPHRAVGSA